MNDHTNPPAGQISDTLERRRLQNRLAQRNHRKKVRDHIKALETRVIKSMLQRPPLYALPLPSSGHLSCSSPPLYIPPHQSPEQNSGPPRDHEQVERTYGSSIGLISPSASSPLSECPRLPQEDRKPYLAPATSCNSLASLCASPSESRIPGVTFEIISHHREPQLASMRTHQSQLCLPNSSDCGDYGAWEQCSTQVRDFEYLSIESTTQSTSLTPEDSITTSPILTHSYHSHQQFSPSPQQRQWLTSLSSTSADNVQAGVVPVYEQFQSPDSHQMPESNRHPDSQTPDSITQPPPSYLDDLEAPHFLTTNPTQNFHQSMAIYRSPRFD